MAQVIWRENALESLTRILEYGKELFGETAAVRLYGRIEELTAQVGKFPESGFREPALAGRPIEYRSLLINSRFKLIYFKYVINGVEYVVIAELWDTRMNPEILQNNL